jgi:hypothetical protein
VEEPGRNDFCPSAFRPFRDRTKGLANERVVFLNSIGGLGDCLPMPLITRWYKKFYPEDTTILYDSLFIHHFYEPFPWVDEVYRAGEHVFANYMPNLVLNMDPSLPREGGIPLRETRFTRLVSTHHAHGRILAPEGLVIKMDFWSVLVEILRHGFRSFDMRLKPEHMTRVDSLMRELTGDARTLIGMQTRGACPYGALMLPRDEYVRDLTIIAGALVEKYGARVLICGDDRLLSEERYAGNDWIALDELTPNIYYKLEIMKRTRLYLAATSGFSLLVNLMRTPEQIPAIQIYTNPQTLLGATFKMYPNYVKDGGCMDVALTVTFRYPDMTDFLFDAPHTPEKVLAFVERFLQ